MFGPTYEAGCPTCSSMADTIDGALPHLHARDVTMTYLSQAPLEKLQAYKRRMGWQMPWVSSADSDFNFDLGYSRTEEQTREAFAPMLEAGPPPVLDHNARSTGTDVTGYLSQGPGFSVFVLDDGTAYQTYGTTARGLEFLMGYYGILGPRPKGRTKAANPRSGSAGTTSTRYGLDESASPAIAAALAPAEQKYLSQARQMQALSFAVHILSSASGSRSRR